jgi:hypothetical protein
MSGSGVADGKTLSTAIAISPSVASMTPATIALTSSNESKQISSSDGKCKDTAIAISPTITEQQQLIQSAEGNLCKPITAFADANRSRKPWALSPQVKARLGIPGLQRGSPASVSPEVAEAVRKFSESVVKSGFLSRFAANQSSSAGDGSRKRKHMSEGTSSSGATRDNRVGMFTPPGFDLGFSSPDTIVSDSQKEEFSSQEYAVPKSIPPIAPLDWAGPSGISSFSPFLLITCILCTVLFFASQHSFLCYCLCLFLHAHDNSVHMRLNMYMHIIKNTLFS